MASLAKPRVASLAKPPAKATDGMAPGWRRSWKALANEQMEGESDDMAAVRGGGFDELIKVLDEHIADGSMNRLAIQDRLEVDDAWRLCYLEFDYLADDEDAKGSRYFKLLDLQGHEVDEPDTPSGTVSEQTLLTEWGSWYRLPDEAAFQEDEEEELIEDGDIVEWDFGTAGVSREHAIVRLRSSDPTVPAHKAMLLARFAGRHELVRLTDLVNVSHVDKPDWDSKNVPAMLLKCNHQVAGTLYGETKWLWASENTTHMKLFAAVQYSSQTEPIVHGHQVSL